MEIGRKYIKLLQSAQSGPHVIADKLIVEQVLGLSDDQISEFFFSIIESNNLSFDSIKAVISREKVIVRYIKLPAVSRPDIDKMVVFEIAKQTPYSKEDIVSDYRIIGKDDKGYSTIMLAISPKLEIARIDSILGKLKNKLKCIYFSSEAMAGWLKVALMESRLGLQDAGGRCLIDIDSERTDISVISALGLCFSRSIPIGSDDIIGQSAGSDSAGQRLVDEIRQSIAMYLKEKDADKTDISEFVLTGAGSAGNNLLELLKSAVDIPCVFIGSLEGAKAADSILSESGIPDDASVCSIFGCQFIDNGTNLLSLDEKIKNLRKAVFKKILSAAAVLFAVILISLTAGLIKIQQRQEVLVSLELMYSQIKNSVEQTEEKIKKINSVKAYLSQEESSLDVIYNLYTLIPAGIQVLDFNYDDLEKKVRFNGIANKMSDVFNMITVLEDSNAFSNVHAQSLAQRDARGGAVVDFQMRCNFQDEKSKQE
jgi:Tfp pilus assembly PilM family ATPase/Tfp pilus assembly protein PilN